MRTLRIAAQVTALAAIYRLGSYAVERLRLPVPGNVLGMLMLFGLLCTGAVKESWIADGAGLLTRHLSFFFVPIVVGLIDWAGLLVDAGSRLLAALVASSLLGLFVTGRVAQLLVRNQPRVAVRHRRAEAKS